MGKGELASVTRSSWATRQATPGLVAQLVGLVKSMRPQQWHKQLVLYIAVVLSLNATSPAAWGTVTLGAIAFSAVTRAVYLFNDVCDVEEDRQHPSKKHRPITSGQVPIPWPSPADSRSVQRPSPMPGRSRRPSSRFWPSTSLKTPTTTPCSAT